MGCVNSVPASVKETPSMEDAPMDRPFGTFPRKNSVTRASMSRRSSVSKKTEKESTAHSAAQFSVFLAHKGQQADVKDNINYIIPEHMSTNDTGQPPLDHPGPSAHSRGSCALQLALLQSPKTGGVLQRVLPPSPSCEDADVVVLTIPVRARVHRQLSSGLCAPPPCTPADTAVGTPAGGKVAVVGKYALASASLPDACTSDLPVSPSRDPSPSALAVDFVIRLAQHSPDAVREVSNDWHWQPADAYACTCAETGARPPAGVGRAAAWEEAKTDEAAEEREERRSVHSAQAEPCMPHTEGAAHHAVQLASPPARQHRRVRVRMRMPTVRVVCALCHEYEEAPVQDVRVRGASVAALEVADEHADVYEEDGACLAASAVTPLTPRTPRAPLSTRPPAHAATPWSPALRVCAATPLPQPPAEGLLNDVACVAGACDGEGALLRNLTRPGVVGLCAGAHASPRARYVWADCASVDIPAAVGALGGSSERVYVVNHAIVNPRHFLLLNDNVFAIDDGPVVSYVCAACAALDQQRRADAGECAVATLDAASTASASAGGAASATSPTSGPSLPWSVGSPAPRAHCTWHWPGDALGDACGAVRDRPARASLCSSLPTSTAVCLPTARSALPAPDALTPPQRISGDDPHTALLFRSPLPAAPLEAPDAPPPLPVQSTHALSCLFSAHSLPSDRHSTGDADTGAHAATAALASARASAVTRAYWSLCAGSPAAHAHAHTPTLYHTPHTQPTTHDADTRAAAVGACVSIAGLPLAGSPAAPSTGLSGDSVPPPPSLRAGARGVADGAAHRDGSGRRGSVEHSVAAPGHVAEDAATGQSGPPAQPGVAAPPAAAVAPAAAADGESPPVRRRRGSSVYTFPLTPPAQRGAQAHAIRGHARTRSDVPLLALGGPLREGREGKRSSKAEPPVFRACTCGACGLCATVYCSVYGLSGACGRCMRCLGYNSK